LQGFLDIPLSTQGFGCCAAFTLGFAALRFQRFTHSTRMLEGTGKSATTEMRVKFA
jgi:hypothetical protein